MKAAKECCRRTFCARSLIFMASASIIFWNELIKRTKTTADAVVFSIKMRRAQQCRLGRHYRNRIIRSRRNAYRKCHGVDNPKRRGKAPPFWSLGVQGRDRNAPAVLLGDQKGVFSHVREYPLCLRTPAARREFPSLSGTRPFLPKARLRRRRRCRPSSQADTKPRGRSTRRPS